MSDSPLEFPSSEDVEMDELEVENDLPISDEPELIAEIPSTSANPSLFDQSSNGAAVEPFPEEPHIASTVCETCQELNLTQKQHIITCLRCEQAFCYHFTSSVDAQYCVNCMSDISVTKQVITKEYVHRDDERQVTSVYRRRAREVQIKGLDWLFAQRRIADLSDAELDLQIEYHRNILQLLLIEQEQRRTARLHRYAGVKISIPRKSVDNTKTENTTTTTVKRTKTVSKNKQAEQVAAILNSMQAGGMSLDQILAKLKTKK